MTGLGAIAAKEPVITTFDTQALHVSAAAVRDNYDWHAVTYSEPPPVAALRQAFIEQVRQARTPKACLSAPFGYGKTATAIGIWKACQEARLLAIPPISCGSFPDLARALCDWLVFVLPDDRLAIESAYDHFLVSSAEILARRDERLFGIGYDQAVAANRDKLERGYLDFEDASINLLAFVEYTTELALRAGYQGLVVTIDEFQQLLGNASKGVLVALRQLIWGLRTRQISFGLLLTMDPDTERTLTDRAGDIMHRIKDDGLYLDLGRIYDRDFPARLWSQYTAAFDLDPTDQQAIDRPALDALGQLCEREDLSNGPRTVINVLQQAATRQQAAPGTSYTPLNLVEDLLIGTVHFAGDRGVLPALVAELLNFPYFQRSLERSQALKLLAAFPRGCSASIATLYGLAEAWRELGDDLRGEIITELDEGLALIELQRVGRPADRLNVLLRRYWMQITDRQLFAEDALQSFSEIVLPLLFPSKVHDLRGWTGANEVLLSSEGGYCGLLEGTPSSKYPLRRIGVTVVPVGALASPRPAQDLDLQIVFRLDLSPQAISVLHISPAEGLIECNLAMARPAEAGLRGGLAWIEHYVSPQPVSSAVVLSLLRYFARETGDPTPDRDQARIADTIARLEEWLLAELLPPDLFRSAGFTVVQAGYGGLKEFLHLFLSRRWPEYQTIVTQQHWKTLMSDYEAALRQVPQLVRIGARPAQGTKAEIAQFFRQTHHAGFESRARQYGDLLQIVDWQGDAAAVRFQPHQAELKVVGAVRRAGTITKDDAYQDLRSAGLASVEADLVIQLACTRGLIVAEAGCLTVPDAPSYPELVAKARTLQTRCMALPTVPNELKAELARVMEGLNEQTDRSETVWQLDSIAARLALAEDQARRAEQAQRAAARADLINELPRLATPLSGAGTGRLTKHLAALHRQLDNERQRLRTQAENLLADSDHCMLEDLQALSTQVVTWKDQATLYARWIDLARRTECLQTSLERLAASTGELHALHSGTMTLISTARALLAEVGSRALPEVGRLEADLIHMEHHFQALGQARAAAYEHVAGALCAQTSQLLGLATPIAGPLYNPGDDNGSFDALFETVAIAASRALALLGLEVTGEQGSTSAKLARARLRADIRMLAQRARDPGWLIAQPYPRIQAQAGKAINAIRQRVAREFSATPPDIATVKGQLVRVLSALPPGPMEMSVIVQRINGLFPHTELLAELMRLHEAGLLRILVDLPAAEEDLAR